MLTTTEKKLIESYEVNTSKCLLYFYKAGKNKKIKIKIVLDLFHNWFDPSTLKSKINLLSHKIKHFQILSISLLDQKHLCHEL